MKKIVNYVVPALSMAAIVFSVAAFNEAQAAPQDPEVTEMSTATAVQPVDLTYAAEKALPCVVHIKYVQNSKIQTVEVQSDPFDDFFSDPFGGFFGRGQRGQGGTRKQQVQTPKKTATGSGVIISSDGYIVTNNHVVDGADELTVTLHDSKEYSARIIGADKTTDLALIKIDGKNLPAIRIANSDNVKVGEWVLAIGNPLGLNNTVTAGIISAKARTLGANGVESFIQTDAAINAGNSGGALVNTNGELVGINAMLYSQTGSYSGYGFAIPTAMMNKVVADLKQYGTVQRAMIGISGRDVKTQVDLEKEDGKEVKDYGTMEGIYVAEVVDNSAAAEAGIEKGDILVEVDGQKLTKFGDLSGIIAQKRPGDKINLTYLHNKKKQTKQVTLRNEQGNTKVVKNADLDVLGADFREVSKAQKEQLEISYGLEVIKVNAGKMKDAGITKGFIIQRVNDEAMKTVEDLQDAVKDASTSKEPVLVIKGLYPTGKRGYFIVQLQND
ncbi:Do family serine endopeptidase [Prevotella sp. E2-28]|uniref:Do family serine endopeptidase n=1 Tax=Prevotella sp. E2-28 TaxID=2913620 RepID=UPI001EDAAEE8|nr:Do family serine endopeptidase [Prevotella sp. E2-28]UKK54688.1 Do family serine endopeptidase [Prevotella sp. E2-28]